MTTTDAAIQDIETVLYDGASMHLEDRAKLARELADRLTQITEDLEDDVLKEQRDERAHERHLEQLRSE